MISQLLRSPVRPCMPIVAEQKASAGADQHVEMGEALRAADLLETFNGVDRFTVFAPDNEAFEKLPVGTLDNLLRPENRKDLRRLLRRHVISGWVLNAFSIPEGTSEVLSFGTEPINLIKTNGQISIQSSEGTANVLFADGLATNGVVHVVDTVF